MEYGCCIRTRCLQHLDHDLQFIAGFCDQFTDSGSTLDFTMTGDNHPSEQSPNSPPENSSPKQISIDSINLIIRSSQKFIENHVINGETFVSKLGMLPADFIPAVNECKRDNLPIKELVNKILEAWVSKNGDSAKVGVLSRIFEQMGFKNLSRKLTRQYSLDTEIVHLSNQDQNSDESQVPSASGPLIPTHNEDTANDGEPTQQNKRRRRTVSPWKRRFTSKKSVGCISCAVVIALIASIAIANQENKTGNDNIPDSPSPPPLNTTADQQNDSSPAEPKIPEIIVQLQTAFDPSITSTKEPSEPETSTAVNSSKTKPRNPFLMCAAVNKSKTLWETKMHNVTSKQLVEECVHRWKHLVSRLEHPSLLNFILKHATNVDTLIIEAEICNGLQNFNDSLPISQKHIITSGVKHIFFGHMNVECNSKLFMWIALTWNLTQVESFDFPKEILISPFIVDSFNNLMSRVGPQLQGISITGYFTLTNELLFSNVSFTNLTYIFLNNTAKFGTVSKTTMTQTLKASTKSPIVTIFSNLPIPLESCPLVVIFHNTLQYLNLLLYLREELTFDFKTCFVELSYLKSLSVELTDQRFSDCSGKNITLLNFNSKYFSPSLRYVQIKSTCPLDMDNHNVDHFEYRKEGKYQLYIMQI